MNNEGRQILVLKEVVLGIAFPLRRQAAEISPLIMGNLYKAGKLLWQAYYSFTSKYSLPPTLGSTEGWISYSICSWNSGLL